MQANVLNEFSGNFANSLSALFALVFVYIVIYITSGRFCELERKIKKVRMRGLYICSIIFAITLARIWVEGFMHLLTVLGLVSAALVITNKESIMNLTGWLILNWREVFTEGDLVQVHDKKGYVKSIGPFYITMEEVMEKTGHLKTARIIKLPNNLIITHPIINYTYETKPILQKLGMAFKASSDIQEIKELLDDALQHLTDEAKELRSKEKNKKIAIRNDSFHSKNYHISFDLVSHEHSLIETTVYFYSYINEYDELKYQFLENVLSKVQHAENVELL